MEDEEDLKPARDFNSTDEITGNRRVKLDRPPLASSSVSASDSSGPSRASKLKSRLER